jgi:DNA-binding response OmpR family regulator
MPMIRDIRAAEIAQRAYRTSEPRDRRRTESIMVATRDTGTRALISFILRAANFDVAEAIDVDSTIETAHAMHPDLVILDQDLDRSHCVTTCSRLQDPEQPRPTPIIILTDRISELDLYAARSAGVAGFMSKPAHLPDLVEHIRILLPKSREQKSSFLDRIISGERIAAFHRR